jgi:hypothetical protein
VGLESVLTEVAENPADRGVPGVRPARCVLVDVELLEEVRLLTHLIIAATDATGPLGQRVIDQLLGPRG